MMKLMLCAALFALAAAVPTPELSATLSFESRIIGGSTEQISNYPHQASLRFSGSHTCGAVVMGSTKVLTAAHCTDGRVASGFSVYAGSNSRTSGGSLVSSLSKDEHNDYNNGACTFCNDVCMLTLGSTLSGINIAAASLPPTNNDFAGSSCRLTGWGRTGTSSILPDALQGVTMTVMTEAACTSAMSAVGGTVISSAHICILGNGSQGSCNGDSGGPMTCGGNTVAGVTSWGVSSGGNCMPSYPSVYARVSTFDSWIRARL